MKRTSRFAGWAAKPAEDEVDVADVVEREHRAALAGDVLGSGHVQVERQSLNPVLAATMTGGYVMSRTMLTVT